MTSTHVMPLGPILRERDSRVKDKSYQQSSVGQHVRRYIAKLRWDNAAQNTCDSYETTLARLAWERSQPQLFLDIESSAPPGDASTSAPAALHTPAVPDQAAAQGGGADSELAATNSTGRSHAANLRPRRTPPEHSPLHSVRDERPAFHNDGERRNSPSPGMRGARQRRF